jgi:hypothetical protein
MAEYYVSQERAFAPGIVTEWPDIIPNQFSKHGRLKKLPNLHDLMVAIDSEMSAIARGRPVDKDECQRISNEVRKVYEG